MSQIETIDDAQRTTRWLAESQYQLSHVIPSLVEERERLRRALEAREQECERLGGELGELRRIHGALQGELDALRGERSAVARGLRRRRGTCSGRCTGPWPTSRGVCRPRRRFPSLSRTEIRAVPPRRATRGAAGTKDSSASLVTRRGCLLRE